MDADVLDLTQVAPSPAPSARRCPDGCSEPAAAAAVAAVPVRNRPPHRSREISSVRRHRDDAASPPLEEDEDDEEEVVEQGAAAPIPETEAGVSGNEDGLREVMPAFSQMTLQELAGMMAVYGLKKKSKRFVHGPPVVHVNSQVVRSTLLGLDRRVSLASVVPPGFALHISTLRIRTLYTEYDISKLYI